MNARFALGAYFIFAAAHMIYMAVPGFGPYAHLRHEFQNPLDGGVFWPLVWTTVAESGALKDIFPSVHTAIPTYCVTFAILHRRQWPYGWVWPILLFWASQIVIATMFLRWHYLIDIVAGLTLAVASALASVRICEWEDGFRRREGLQPVFKPIWPRTEAVSQAEQA
jgi:membrane-associated phospholipid phosphatase